MRRPPWRLFGHLGACRPVQCVRARAMSCRRLTMRLRSTVMLCVRKSSEIPNKVQYGDAEFLRFAFHDVFRLSWSRRLVAVRSVLVSCSLGSTDAHRATRRCATFRARYSSPWCSYAPPPPNSRRRRRPAARRSRHSPSLRRRPSHRRRHRLAPRRQASRGRERSARAAEEKSCTTAMWCTPTPLKFASQ